MSRLDTKKLGSTIKPEYLQANAMPAFIGRYHSADATWLISLLPGQFLRLKATSTQEIEQKCSQLNNLTPNGTFVLSSGQTIAYEKEVMNDTPTGAPSTDSNTVSESFQKPGSVTLLDGPPPYLPVDPKERKNLRLWDFMFNYFPLAWLEVVKVAEAGNRQHDIGAALRWDRTKSVDQLNTAFRHQFDYGTGVSRDTDGTYHLAKAVWRLMAQLQLDIENECKNNS